MDKCLSEQYENLLEAVLSVSLAIMSSVLHDVCATLTFRAAAAAARDLQAPPHRWRHHIAVSTNVARVQVRLLFFPVHHACTDRLEGPWTCIIGHLQDVAGALNKYTSTFFTGVVVGLLPGAVGRARGRGGAVVEP